MAAPPLLMAWERVGDWVYRRWENSQPPRGRSLRTDLWWLALSMINSTVSVRLLCWWHERRHPVLWTAFSMPSSVDPAGRWS